MISQLLRKWFNLSEPVCTSCETLRFALDESNRERKELLHRLLTPQQVEPPSVKEEEFQPITPKFVPWRVRQQTLEAEDRKSAQLMRDKEREISKLEKELGIQPITSTEQFVAEEKAQ